MPYTRKTRDEYHVLVNYGGKGYGWEHETTEDSTTPEALCALVSATTTARERTGRLIGTSAKRGQYRVVDVTYDSRGKATVTPLSGYGTLSDTLYILETIGPFTLHPEGHI